MLKIGLTHARSIKEFREVDDINDVWKDLFYTQKKVAPREE